MGNPWKDRRNAKGDAATRGHDNALAESDAEVSRASAAAKRRKESARKALEKNTANSKEG